MRPPSASDRTSGIYLLHIPTAGTTVASVLRHLASGSTPRVIGPCLPDDLLRTENRDWRHADLSMGHLARLPIEAEPSFRTVTVLRDPFTHLHSWYRHVRREPGHFLHRTVIDEELSFSKWLDDERAATLTDNPQARHLGLVPHLPHEPFEPSDPTRVQRAFDLHERRMTDEELLARASATLAGMELVGTVERLPEFVSTLAAMTGCEAPTIPKLNADPVASLPVDEVTAERIRRRCSVDIELHRRVSERRAAIEADEVAS